MLKATMRGLATIAVVFLSPGGGMGAAGAATLCERVDWSGPHEGLGPNFDRFGTIQRSYQRSDGLTLIKAALPHVYASLESPDPVTRRDACTQLRAMREWFQWREKELDAEAVHRLVQLLDRETNVQVVDEAVRALGRQKAFRKEVVPYIVQILRCPAAGASKQEALQVAREGIDSALVEPLLELWKSGATVPNRELVLATLAELKDPRAASVAMEAMAEGLSNAPLLFRAVGSRETLPAAIETYRKTPPRGTYRWNFLETAAEIGGSDAVAFLKEEFKGTAESEKGDLADKVLQAQLEPGKPVYTEEDRRNCRPADEVQARQLPLLRKEVERLLHDDNRPYFSANRWRNSVVLGNLLEWGRSLEPGARVTHLRRVLDLVGDGPAGAGSRTSFPRDLLLALASRASVRTASDPAGALQDLEEAERLPSVRGSNLDIPLRALRARIDRLTPVSEGEPAPDVGDLVGTFKRGGGFGTHTLTLKPDGSYDYVGTSDAIDMCRPSGYSSTGRYITERGYVVFTPGPGVKGFGIDGSDALLPVPWGARMYLLSDEEVPEFCKGVNEGSMAAPSRLRMAYHYVRAAGDEPPTGQPRVPERWKAWLLAEPILGSITRLATDGAVEVDVGAAKGLKVGMNLFAGDDSARRRWRIVEVTTKTSLARPYSADQPLPPTGMRVSTRESPLAASMGAIPPQPAMVAARVRTTAEPVTPATAGGVSGTVVVTVLVDEKGRVVEVTGYKQQMGRGMDEAAAEAVKNYEFEPATQDGRPIPSIVNVPVSFVAKP